jgi:predicted amidophosphoribosyltransferase
MVPRVLSEVLAVLAPPGCAACGRSLARAHAIACPECLRGLPWRRGPRCPRCGLAPHRGGARCPAQDAAFALAWSPMAYEATARALVVALKFRGALPVAGLMAAQMAATAPPGLLRPGAVLVPVPLHPARRRRRGFDQAHRLALALGQRTGLEVSACLRRRGPATRQLGAGRTARRSAARLEVRAHGPVPAHAVLVDDVHTTGATFEACARALRASGSAHVCALAYARTE